MHASLAATTSSRGAQIGCCRSVAGSRRSSRAPRHRGRLLAPAPRVASDYQASTSYSSSSYNVPSDGSDFYSLLGVLPNASPSEIRLAYRSLSKEFHPDMSADEDATEFQMFLNLVYETLMDPERRAEYDAIAGFDFSPDAINPFLDTSFPADFAFVDEAACIGCRNCNNVCPKTFGMEDEYGRARVYNQGADPDDKIDEAIDTCPVSCIYRVTAPQLALLEAQMAKMERVAAWLLLSNGRGGGLSVFQEASMAWEKRQAALRAQYTAAKERAAWAAGFEPAMGSVFQQSYKQATAAAAAQAGAGDAGAEADGTSGSSGRRGRARSAADVAAAARKWRDYQRQRRKREQKMIATYSSASVSSMDAA